MRPALALAAVLVAGAAPAAARADRMDAIANGAALGLVVPSADGRSLLSIYSSTNEAGDSPASYLRNNLKIPRSVLTYHRVTPSFFAIATRQEGSILYSRCNFSSDPNGGIHCIDLVYPRTEKRAWDGIVTRISRSLRPLEG